MSIPLAEKIRPKVIKDFIGQEHLVGQSGVIREFIKKRNIPSMILWGPPGCGKTTLAQIIADQINANFTAVSAVDFSVTDLKEIINQIKKISTQSQIKTIIFIDEIHRLNKNQQDFLLPYVEKGIFTLIGATTENPGFEVIAPLISRCHIFLLYPLKDKELETIINRALKFLPGCQLEKEALEFLVSFSNGDARVAINALELASEFNQKITKQILETALQHKTPYYDKKGDVRFDTVSAFIKSMRGGDPNATLHYLARMIKGGEDPVFIARRMVIFASEDIGNAQPTALVLATSCMQAVHMVGMPEATLILAQTATYLATAKKSIASTVGIQKALRDLEKINPGPIPLHLRNPTTKISRRLGYGKNHIRYPWLEEKKTAKKITQEYLPTNLKGKKYYFPDW